MRVLAQGPAVHAIPAKHRPRQDPRSGTMKPTTFNLRWWFGLAGFGTIAVLAILCAMLMSQYISVTMLAREVEVTREFLQGIVRAEALDAGTFTTGKTDADSDLGSFVDHLNGLPEVLRVNIYARDRSILWSTDKTLIGRRFPDNDELETAFGGQTLSEVVSGDGDTKAEHEALAKTDVGYFIEAYIPLYEKDKVIAVVELYQAPVTLDGVLRHGKRIIWLSAAASALFLYATLYWIVVRAARLIERQRTEISRMEALAALGQMAGGIAHNLRNPMAGIRSSAELMKLEIPEAKETADDIMGEVDRLEGCVRQLLEFTRAEKLSPRRIDPLRLVEDTLGQHRPALERHRIVVTIEDTRRAKRQVEVDPLLISQAMTTILVNALEAMPEGGRLRIQLSERGSRLCIAYTDSGPGIPAEILARIGEPFYTTKTRGFGLGLAMARRIVERFDGSLAIGNAAGGGAQVQIELAMV